MSVNRIELNASTVPVKSATIFQSSTAEVTRTLAVELKTGQNVVEVSGISSVVNSESPRINSAAADVRVLDVVCTRKPGDAPDLLDDERSTEIQSLIAEGRALEAERRVHEEEVVLLNDAGRLVTTDRGDSTPPELLKFIDAHAQRKLALRKTILSLDERIKELEKKLWLLRKSRKGEATTVVTATVIAKVDRKVDLKLTYLVSGVSWTPFYDLHATTADTQPSADVFMHYCATITQSTGEDWTDATLTLSTARSQAQTRLSVPTLKPLKIKRGNAMAPKVRLSGGVFGNGNAPQMAQSNQGFGLFGLAQQAQATPLASTFGPNGAGRGGFAGSSAGVGRGTYGGFGGFGGTSNAPQEVLVQTAFQAQEPAVPAFPAPAPVDPEQPPAFVEFVPPSVPTRSSLSVSYRVDGTVNLPSDGQEHKLTIAVLPFKASLKYTCVPRHSQAVFIVGAVKNTSEYELLAGPVNVFMDNSFVSKTAVGFIAVDESFGCVLGVDTSLKVEYRHSTKTEHEERRSFAEPNKTTTRTVTTTITNRHQFDIAQVLVRDAIPLGDEDEQIAVHLKKPEGLASAEEGKDVAVALEGGQTAKVRWTKVVDGKGGEKDGFYEWLCAVPAGKKIALEAQWGIKAPSKMEWIEA
ncbi:hypothetical protein C8Q79DRAFT_904375 [Trametes meyenii]|nr:hypothetical protein C8Q79DRAFT_904375 [Trametes meyenii]